MPKDPWTDSDPQPGDFDDFLASIDPDDPGYVERHVPRKGSGRGGIVVTVEGDDARRLASLSRERGQTVSEVISDLVRAA